MTEKAKINGIRLNRNHIQVTQEGFDEKNSCRVPLYQMLDSNRINMVFMNLNTMGKSFVSGSIASKHFGLMAHGDDSRVDHSAVSLLSIYPHHYSLKVLGNLLSFLGRQNVWFHHMVSSNSMLTLVVDQHNCDAVVQVLSEGFDLPKSHVPFEQDENEELTQFLKKKYPETRATYVEEKIKTYGITLLPDMILGAHLFSVDQWEAYGKKIQSLADGGEKFFHTSAHVTSALQTHLFLLTRNPLDIPTRDIYSVDFLSFHGPHFGDRHSIVSRALNCLFTNAVPIFHVGCTGSSISMILRQGNGKAARQVLMEVFEIPS